MINDDQRGDDRQSSGDSQPNKRKRITTGSKSYDSNKYQGSSDSREKKPLFSSDKGSYNKPYSSEGRESYDPNKRSFERKPFQQRDDNSKPYIKRNPDYNKDYKRDSYNRDGNRDGNRDNYNRDNFNRDGNRENYNRDNYNRDGNRDNYNRDSYNRDGNRDYNRDSNRDGNRDYNRDGNRDSGRDYNRNSSYQKDNRSFPRKSYNDDRRPSFKKTYGQGSSRDEQSSYGRSEQSDRRSFQGKPGGRPFNKSFQKGPVRQFNTKPRQPIYNFNDIPDDAPVRLNKYIANTGLCSRREADDYIQAGLITVNGVVVSQLGSKVLPTDEIRYNNERLQAERKVYILLNKPKDYVTSVDDPHAKRTVMELVQGACKERIYPVGRLDRMTTGVLLLTNDGELTKKLTHPTSNYRKIYQVQLEKNVKAEDIQAIRDGVTLDDGVISADNINYVFEDDNSMVGIEIHSGRNRIIRRLFEHLGYKVLKLDRIYFAGLTKKGLSRGMWRYLDPKEVGFLKMLKA